MYKYFFLIVLIIFTGCSQNEQPYVSKRVYKKISKNAVLDAAKKLFILADEKQYLTDSYRNKIESKKVRVDNKILYIDLVEDKWILEVVQEKKMTRAHLSLKRRNSIDDKERYNKNKELHRMFWSRIDYLLGINDKWYTCEEYLLKNIYDGILCDPTFITNKNATKSDVIKNIEISEKANEIFTLDKVDAEIYRATDLSIIKKEDDILKDNTDSLEESKDKIEDRSDEELMQLKNEMSTIIDDKGNMEILNTDMIIDKESLIKENSEFNLEPEKIEK